MSKSLTRHRTQSPHAKPDTASTIVAAAARHWLSRLNRLLIAAAEAYERRAEGRRHAWLLRGLDDHTLKDIGISRADAEREASDILRRR